MAATRAGNPATGWAGSGQVAAAPRADSVDRVTHVFEVVLVVALVVIGVILLRRRVAAKADA